MKKIFPLHEQTQIAISGLKPAWQVIHLPKIDSTNNYAKKNLTKLKLPALITSEHQTHGRGRGQNTWEDLGSEHQFLSTWTFRLPFSKSDPRWTIAAGYKIYGALQNQWMDLDFSIKAPNDIYLNGKKLGGILLETTNFNSETVLFVGLGLNIFSRPSKLANTAIALVEAIEHLHEDDWKKLVAAFATCFAELESFVSNPHWLESISESLRTALNKNPHYRNNRVRKITPNGSLELDQGYLDWLEL